MQDVGDSPVWEKTGKTGVGKEEWKGTGNREDSWEELCGRGERERGERADGVGGRFSRRGNEGFGSGLRRTLEGKLEGRWPEGRWRGSLREDGHRGDGGEA